MRIASRHDLVASFFVRAIHLSLFQPPPVFLEKRMGIAERIGKPGFELSDHLFSQCGNVMTAQPRRTHGIRRGKGIAMGVEVLP